MMKCDPFEPHPFNSICFEFGASVHQVHQIPRAPMRKTVQNAEKPEFWAVFREGCSGEVMHLVHRCTKCGIN
jgi:hypothetical protein